MGKWAGVIGDPIQHSWSPILHRQAYADAHINITYDAIHVTSKNLQSFISERIDATCAGLSVTMPHKQRIMPLLDKIDSLAKMVGSVNTVVPSSGLLTGWNTDVFGIVHSLYAGAGQEIRPRKAVIFGARATASSALIGLYGEMACSDVTICARRVSGEGSVMQAAARAHRIPNVIRLSDLRRVSAAVEQAEIIISTLPAHAMDDYVEHLPLHSGHIVLDAVYSPLNTALNRHATTCGATVVPGWLMLVYQAIPQVQLFCSRTTTPGTLIGALVESGKLLSKQVPAFVQDLA
ncbi:MAG: shikimate dehydrogenase [Actinomycetaceae bacterium]|nr:shikimate dehydrogenase [Actinomycetaceae bacterium]